MSCDDCKGLEESIERMRVDVENHRNQNTQSLRIIGQLRKDLAEHLEEEPEGPDIKRLLLLWRDEVKGGSNQVSIRLDGPRALRVRWALKRWKPERLEHAILGVLHDDWAMGRDRRTKGRDYNDIAKHIFKDEETIERFEKLYKQGGDMTSEPALARFLKLVEVERQMSTGDYAVRCPAHEDDHASLSVAQGRTGVIVNCKVGCSAEAIAGAVGWPVSELFDREPQVVPVKRIDPLTSEQELDGMCGRLLANKGLLERLQELRGWSSGTLAALGVGFDGQRIVLPIRDREGTLVNALRYKPASLKPNEPKMLSLRGRPRDLFPPPESHDGDVWLVEGEPDAITGITLGLPVSGVPGSNGWRGEWTARFKDRRVVVCFDCDGPGRNAAGKVALALAPVAKDVRVLELDAARMDGFDLTAFVLAGGAVEELQRMADAVGSVVAHRRAA